MSEEKGKLYTHALLLNNNPVAKFHSEESALKERNKMAQITASLNLSKKQAWTVAKITDDKTIENEGSEKQKREARRKALLEKEIAKSRAQLQSRQKRNR